MKIRSFLALLLLLSLASCGEPVAGVDEDEDGIRDDVQEFINKKYKDKKVKAAVVQYAKNFQKTITESESKELSLENSKNGFRALNCLIYVTSINETAQISREMRAEILNTRERLEANSMVNEHLNGSITSSAKETKESCDSQLINTVK